MKTVLITGGSEGIGYAFASYYVSEGMRLILTGRNTSRLQDAKRKLGGNIQTIAMDLSVSGAAEKLYAMTAGQNVDIVINNAGCGYTGVSWENGSQKDEQMIILNDASVLVLSNLFAKRMKERGSGIILNVASTGAFQPGPYIAAYYASKSFVLSYTRALHEEMKGTGVQVYCLCPGPVRTSFYEKSGARIPHTAVSPESVVRFTVRHMKKCCMIIPGVTNRLVCLLPQSFRMHAVKIMKERMMRNHASAG